MKIQANVLASFKNLALFLVCFLSTGVFVGPSFGIPEIGGRGSVIVFPLFDSRPGVRTCLTITNTNRDHRSCGNGFRVGDVELRYVYFEAGTCVVQDRTEVISPGDTLTVIAGLHNPLGSDTGFLVVQAKDPETSFPIDFDYLLGSATIMSSVADGAAENGKWTYLAYAFEGVGSIFFDSCARDVITMSNDILFDDVDYESFPDRIILDHLEGFGSPLTRPGNYSGTLYVMNPANVMASADLSGWNNNEQRFTTGFQVDPCLQEFELSDLSSSFSQANLAMDGNPDELLGISTGWARINASNPNQAFLGVYREKIAVGPKRFIGGRALSVQGSRLIVLSLP